MKEPFLTTVAIVSLGVSLAACGADSTTPPPADMQVAPVAVKTAANEGAITGTAAQEETPPVPETGGPIGKIMDEYGDIANAYLIVGRPGMGTIYVHKKGNQEPDKQIPIASASKWLTAALAMKMIEDNQGLTLDSKASDYFDFWTTDPTDPRSGVQFGHLLSLTSGFAASPANLIGCEGKPYFTLQGCARSLYINQHDGRMAGSTFDYGPNHLQIAAAIMETVAQTPFKELFQQRLVEDIGMTGTEFHALSGANPRAAGGVRSTANDYALFLQRVMEEKYISDLDAFLYIQTAQAQTDYIPKTFRGEENFQYALGSFRQCFAEGPIPVTLDRPCAYKGVNTSPGAFGFLPWIDRENGYYAVIATRLYVDGHKKGIELQRRLMPEIVEQLIVD